MKKQNRIKKRVNELVRILEKREQIEQLIQEMFSDSYPIQQKSRGRRRRWEDIT